MKWIVALIGVLTLLPGGALAAQSPEQLVRTTTEQMLSALRANREVIKKNPDRIYGLVDQIVLPHFDFETMARSVLGIYWRRASASQRSRFVKEFKVLLVRTYASSLGQYKDQKIDYLPMRPSADPDSVTVRTKIEQRSGFPVPVDYRLERTHSQWKVVGVVIDQLDLVVNYRSSFGAEIRQIGLNGLIHKLAVRNKQATQ